MAIKLLKYILNERVQVVMKRLALVGVCFFPWYFLTYAVCPAFYNYPIFFITSFSLGKFSNALIWLTIILVPISMWTGRKYTYSGFYYFLLFLLECFLIFSFLTKNILFFYVCFESSTIIMFFIILFWGYEKRRSLAAYYFFYFTFFSSLLFLGGIIMLYVKYGSFDLGELHVISLSSFEQLILWWLFFFAFAVKIPMFPFHIWLPEAHVEAPTGGSILLAAVLLKLGFYGFFRYSIPLLPFAGKYYGTFIITLAIFGIYHSMLVALRQIDAKRIIAYSSIAHMNFAIIGLFSGQVDGVLGSMFLVLTHGIVSSGLFFLIGCLYVRYGTRSIFYYGGLLYSMPFFSFFLFLFSLGNIAFPLTANFVAEFLVFVSLALESKLVFFLMIPAFVLNMVNTLLLYMRLVFGVSQVTSIHLDLGKGEIFILLILSFFMMFFGVFPMVILNQLSFDSHLW